MVSLLTLQALAQLAGRQKNSAIFAGKRAVVDKKIHGNGRFIDDQGRQRHRVHRVGKGEPDRDVRTTRDRNDIAGFGGFDFTPAESKEALELGSRERVCSRPDR